MSATETAGTARARNADATRAALLEAATKRFTVLGYERTTTRDIAADAGANVSLIARYFGSKEGLFAQVLRESTNALEQLRQRGADDLATSIVNGLQQDSWPEFGGEHPLLLLVSGADDDVVGKLRRRSLDDITSYLSERVAGADSPLHGDLVLALVVGILTVRSARPHGALANADEIHLHDVTERLLAAVAAIS